MTTILSAHPGIHAAPLHESLPVAWDRLTRKLRARWQPRPVSAGTAPSPAPGAVPPVAVLLEGPEDDDEEDPGLAWVNDLNARLDSGHYTPRRYVPPGGGGWITGEQYALPEVIA